MLTPHPLICPECARPAEAGPPAVPGPVWPARWRHGDDQTPLCPTSAVLPSDGEIAVVPATGCYGPTQTGQAGATLRAAASYLDLALSSAARIALPRPEDLTRLLTDMAEATGRLADTAAAAARHRYFTGPADGHRLGPAAAWPLSDRLTVAAAQLTLTARTVAGIAADHHRLHRAAPVSAPGW